MAQEIHPKMNEVTYKFSQGRSIKIPSTYTRSKEFLLETDIFIHAAWRTDEKVVNLGSTKINKFNATFGGSSPLGSFSPIVLEEEKVEKTVTK